MFVARLKVERLKEPFSTSMFVSRLKVARLKRTIFDDHVVVRLKVARLKRTTKKQSINVDILSELMAETWHILRKSPTGFVMPVCLSVCSYKRGFQWTDTNEI